ncbi:AraC family transcriptional regulator [Cohnella faecalis]|uniref:AraC family transcriptional regulator n=1 Tax=Cohnella faecalis TaxID=2315694 RepID=A0A398CM52_9BACL|nr:AraC family transcriptional regulator [Cohnella faecalis]RIE02299.1 AraC family transcriptional regulator [Cohnella faecalis]
MTINYFTILLNHLEQMQIEVASAADSIVDEASLKARDVVYDCNRLLFVKEGRGKLYSQGEEVVLEPGVFCMQLSGMPHRLVLEPGSRMRLQWCHFRSSYGDREIFRTLQIPFHVCVENPEEVSRLFERIIEGLASDKVTARIRMKGVMLDLIGIFLELLPDGVDDPKGSQDLQKIDIVLKYIEDHLSDNITVEDLAGQVYLHPNYFIVFFKGLLGYSPIQYVNQRRMELAKALLVQPECNVSDVANRVGMQIYYFSRMFKVHTGLTPSRYRKQALAITASGPEPAAGKGKP